MQFSVYFIFHLLMYVMWYPYEMEAFGPQWNSALRLIKPTHVNSSVHEYLQAFYVLIKCDTTPYAEKKKK